MNIKAVVQHFSWAYLINVVGSAFISNIFILFMSGEKGFSEQQISLIMGIIPILTIPALIIWGKLLDKNKELMRYAAICTFFNALSYITLYFINNFYLFFIVALVRTVLTHPMGSICEEYMIITTKNAQIPYGKVRRVGTIAVGLSGLIAPLIIIGVDIQGLFLIGAVLVLVSACMFKKLPEVHNHKETNEVLRQKELFFNLIKNKNYMMSVGMIGLTYGVLNSCVGYGNQMILLQFECPNELIVALPIILIVFEVLILTIAHKVKVEELPYRAFLIGTMIMCIRWIALALATNYWMVIASTLLHGIIVGITLPAQNYMIAQSVPERCRSTAFLFSVVIQYSIIPGIINLFLGSFLGVMGVSIFGWTYLAVSIAAFLFIIPMRKKEKCSTWNMEEF